MKPKAFQKLIWDYYRANRRDFPWRNTSDPYKIVVSEIMLQQTQTYRVEPKYQAFIAALPSFQALASAPLQKVLSLWQGLGYNRRGLALKKIAEKVMAEYDGKLPNDPTILETFPGIGPATARSICAFAFNRADTFIETNIRAVYIHHFFTDTTKVRDKELLPLIEKTLDQENPREWYWALMDYGVMLKKLHPNPSRRSTHHAKQSKFSGSNRELRGQVLKALTEKATAKAALYKKIKREQTAIDLVLEALSKEGLITKIGQHYTIA